MAKALSAFIDLNPDCCRSPLSVSSNRLRARGLSRSTTTCVNLAHFTSPNLSGEMFRDIQQQDDHSISIFQCQLEQTLSVLTLRAPAQ